MKNSFKNAKYAFVDSASGETLVETGASTFAFAQLEKIIDEPMHIALVVGNSGSGKSTLLESVYKKYRYQKELHYFQTPFLNENDFLPTIFSILTGDVPPDDSEISFNGIINYCNSLKGNREIVLFLDEAQMYPDSILEQIRIISDTKVIKFIIALHDINEKSILLKPHFKTRIWSKVELTNMSKQDLSAYIHSRLLNANISDIIGDINDGEFKLIHKYTDGNYRECNKLMYCVFELCEAYLNDNILRDKNNILNKKIIELSALKLGLANV